MEESVEERKERITQQDGVLHGGAGQRAENCWVLSLEVKHVLPSQVGSCPKESLEQTPYLTFDVIVVTHEGVECSQLCPADTQFLLRVLHEATDVCSHQRDAQEVKSQHTCMGINPDASVLQWTQVVPQKHTDVFIYIQQTKKVPHLRLLKNKGNNHIDLQTRTYITII